MSTIKPINYADMLDSIDIYHFGWSEYELAAYKKQYQSKYYGSNNDARFEITDDEGVTYYVIFRIPSEDEWIQKKSKDYLLFKDQNRVLLNIGGKLYRLLIKERKVLDSNCYNGIISNEVGKTKSLYFHSIVSSDHEVMVIVDCEGIAAINWDNILWKQKFNGAYSGDLQLISINNNQVIAEYDNWSGLFSILFDLQKGKYEMNPLTNVD